MLQVVAPARGQVDGVGQHAARLSEGLAEVGVESRVVAPADVAGAGPVDIFHLHYVPFSFAGYGAGVVPLARALRSRAPMVVTIHEPRIPYQLSPRGVLMAGAQDAILQVLVRLAATVVVSTLQWQRFLRGVRGRLLPSGSVLPLGAAPRARRGVGPVRVGIIASNHPGRMQHLSLATCARLESALGAEIVSLGAGDGGRFPSTGYLDGAGLADAMGDCDLLILPYIDGVSGRRTSFFSALQVGVATLTTMQPPLRDFDAGEGTFAHTPPDREEAFVALAESLAADAAARAQMGRRGREIFVGQLAWPLLAERAAAIYREAAA